MSPQTKPTYAAARSGLSETLKAFRESGDLKVSPKGTVAISRAKLAKLAAESRKRGFAVKLVGPADGDFVAVEFRGLVKIDRGFFTASVAGEGSDRMCEMD